MSTIHTINGKQYAEINGNLMLIVEPDAPEITFIGTKAYVSDGDNLVRVPEQDKAESTPPTRQRGNGRAPAAPRASSARTPKPKANTWTVKNSWKGEVPSPRMVASCLYHGMSVAAVEKARADKFGLSEALGKHLVKAGKFTKIVVEG